MQPQKFLFDLSFDLPGSEPVAPAPQAASDPRALDDLLAGARMAGLAEGRAAALAEAADSAAARVATSLAEIADRLGNLLADATAAAQIRAGDAARLVLAVVRRMAPTLCRGGGFAEIETVVTDCLRRALDEPRIVLRVADGFFDEARARIDTLAHEAGFAGRVVVLADTAMLPGDCRVEWADGGAERDALRLWREIEGTIVRALAACEPSGTAGAMPAADAA